MYSIDKYYDHYVIKQDGDVLFHVDSLLEAEKELEKLKGKEKVEETKNNINTLIIVILKLSIVFLSQKII